LISKRPPKGGRYKNTPISSSHTDSLAPEAQERLVKTAGAFSRYFLREHFLIGYGNPQAALHYCSG
jgi:hypothetical protein